jgi:hypothetical protein
MNTWPLHPIIYEINTWVWLNELSQKYRRTLNQRPYTLGNFNLKYSLNQGTIII